MRLFMLVIMLSLSALDALGQPQQPIQPPSGAFGDRSKLRAPPPKEQPMEQVAHPEAVVSLVADKLFTLSWQAPPAIAGVEADSIVAYQVHWGTQSRLYTEHQTVGKVFTHTIPGLKPNQQYFFSVTAHQAQEQLVYSYAETSIVVRGIPKNTVKLAAKEAMKPGAKVMVQWHQTGSSTPRDWLGLAEVGAPKDKYLAWLYVSCTERGTAAVPKGQCVVTVPATVKPGEYEVRLFANDSFDVVATSAPITITP